MKQRKGTGWSNLHTRIKVQHVIHKNGADKNQKTIIHLSFGLINKPALSIYYWLDWICNDLKLLSFVESENTRRYTNLEKVSRNTFMKYLNLVTEETLLDLLLSPREKAAIEKLNEDTKILNSVTVALQRKNLDLLNVPMLFNETLKNIPELDRNY